mmetsp:Transcript_15712/g.26513  ORF Transcript_15712/g.26513 Transcript_15712/m.26513 type:complete len:266 (+) Transcript_15712:187-984(+)
MSYLGLLHSSSSTLYHQRPPNSHQWPSNSHQWPSSPCNPSSSSPWPIASSNTRITPLPMSTLRNFHDLTHRLCDGNLFSKSLSRFRPSSSPAITSMVAMYRNMPHDIPLRIMASACSEVIAIPVATPIGVTQENPIMESAACLRVAPSRTKFPPRASASTGLCAVIAQNSVIMLFRSTVAPSEMPAMNACREMARNSTTWRRETPPLVIARHMCAMLTEIFWWAPRGSCSSFASNSGCFIYSFITKPLSGTETSILEKTESSSHA